MTTPLVGIFKLRTPFRDFSRDGPAPGWKSTERVGLSALASHKFKHDFRDTMNPMCPTNDGVEDTEHFLLHCPSFDEERRDLLSGFFSLLRPFGCISPSN